MIKIKFEDVLSFFCLVVVAIVIFSRCVWKEEMDARTYVEIQGTTQKFPIELTETKFINNATIENDILTIEIVDTENASIFSSSIPFEVASKLVCSEYLEPKVYWDCTDGKKIIKTIITEVGYQSIEKINGDKTIE